MKILIGEDDTSSRHLLERMTAGSGYEVISAENGDKCWEAILLERPDIAILDWIMPGIEGVSLCRKIRDKESLPYIYIILLTCKGKNQDILTGFDAGADDYIVKPFDKDILLSRVAVGARVVGYDKQLTEKNDQLQRYSFEMKELAEERSRQLVHAERMATVGLLSAGIAHEINNPTSFISGNIQTLDNFWKDVEPVLRSDEDCGQALSEKMNFVLEEMPKTIEGIRLGVKRISKIVNGLKGFCRKGQENVLVEGDVNDCVEQSLELCRSVLKYRITVEKKLTENLPRIKADVQQIEQVMVNLFINAADAMGDKGGILTIETKAGQDCVIIIVGDNGPGFPEDKLDAIKKPFYTTKPAGSGTGLGLFIVRGIIENHQGQIKIENRPGDGALFTITLPVFSEGEKREVKNTNSR